MIERIVSEAFRAQILTREMQSKLQRLLADAKEISKAEFEALAQLRKGILDGAVEVVTRRQYRNVMEELVWEELESRGRVPALEALPAIKRIKRKGRRPPIADAGPLTSISRTGSCR